MPAPRKPAAAPLPRPEANKMEILKALLESGQETHFLDLSIGGLEFSIEYKPLLWMAKSRCVSKATVFVPHKAKDGSTEMIASFQLDVYNREALKEMIVDSPVPFTDTVIEALPPDVGLLLESIIPDPWTAGPAMDAAKKAPGDSPLAAE